MFRFLPTIRRSFQRAFTLVEVLVVVVILGILAAVVTTTFAGAGVNASQKAFVTNLRTFAEVCELYRQRAGMYPADSESGVMPPELSPYLTPREWENSTPIGGAWDNILDSNGVHAAVGVDFNGAPQVQDDLFMIEVDSIFDDGNLMDGVFRKLGDAQYYWVLEL